MANWYTFINCCDGALTATNYRLSTVKPSCLTGKEICSVYLNDTNPTPSSAQLAFVVTYISNALATQSPQPTGVFVKPFVYLRGPVS